MARPARGGGATFVFATDLCLPTSRGERQVAAWSQTAIARRAGGCLLARPTHWAAVVTRPPMFGSAILAMGSHRPATPGAEATRLPERSPLKRARTGGYRTLLARFIGLGLISLVA